MKMIGKREFIFIALILALPIAAWFGIFNPRNKDIPVAQNEIAFNKASFAKADKAYQREFKNYKKKLKQIEDAEKKLDELQPVSEKISSVDFTDQLAEIKNKIDPTLDVVSSTGKVVYPEIGQCFGNQTFSYIVTGRFVSVNKFIKMVERVSPMISIKSYTITSSANRSAKKDNIIRSKVRASLTLQVNFRTKRVKPGVN